MAQVASMNPIPRPRRSVLYMPGSSARALEKARELPVDGVIMDLEDAVAPDAKETARGQVVDALVAGGFGHREVIVRVNPPDTPWGLEDLRATAGAGADAVLLPKVESAETIDRARTHLREARASEEPAIWIMAETPRGVLELDNILGAGGPVSVVVMGTSDLAKALRVRPDGERPGLTTALGQCVLAARAHGLDILDGVHLALNDPRGLEASCRHGRALGFDGKTLIHPQQIEAANEVFGITADEAERARAVIAAWNEASRSGQGVTVVDGRLVEELHAAEAHRVLALYEALAATKER